MRPAKFIAFVFALFFFAQLSFAIVENNSLQVFAVTDDGGALSADLTITIDPGTGKVWSSVHSLVGTATQNSEKITVELARKYFDDVDSYDYKFDINTTASVVDGPSAGSSMALLLISMLENRKLPGYVATTGTINPDGTIGPVGGVFEKARKASESGIRLFLIPDGEAIHTRKFPDGVKSVNLVYYALEEWGLKVVEVKNIDDLLRYAFADIETVDVNKIAKAYTPQFVPKPIPINSRLLAMKQLTGSYIEKTRQKIKSAGEALSKSGIEDLGLTNQLLLTLNSSASTLEDASLLFDQNYLYSSANYAFIATVNAYIVEDISLNPSLAEPDSFALEQKALVLRKEMESLESELDEKAFADFIEWDFAARERLTWAKLNIENILSNQTIVIGASDEDKVVASIERLRDYEFARAWLEIAEEFYGIAKTSVKVVKTDSVLEGKADQHILNAENSLALVDESAKDDILRRINAAKYQREKKWHIPSLVDAVSGEALANAEVAVKNKSVSELKQLLESKIVEVESKISASKREYVWAQIYLDHAKYFLEAVKFYENESAITSAEDAASNGISLAFLASGVLDATNEVYDAIDSLPAESFSDNSVSVPSFDLEGSTVTYALIAVVIVLAGALAFLIVSRRVNIGSDFSVNDKISEIKSFQLDLDKSFSQGKIDEDNFRELSSKYKKQLQDLEREKTEKSAHLLEVSRLKSRLSGTQNLLRELKHHYQKGTIARADYEKELNARNSEITEVKGALGKQLSELKAEKERVKKISVEKPAAKRKGKTGK